MKDTQQFRDILEVNQMTIQELESAANTSVKPARNGKFPHQKFLYTIVEAPDLKLPYYSRPVCPLCGVHFTPVVYHKQKCPECGKYHSPYIDLTPEDCRELGMTWEEANENYLHLPESYKEQYLKLSQEAW